MSSGIWQRSDSARADIQQAGLGRFDPEFDTSPDYEMDCQDCVQCVLVNGSLEDAERIAKRHVDERMACDDVGIQDIRKNGQRPVVSKVNNHGADRVGRQQ